MSKIIKKQDITVLIESTLKKAGIKGIKKPLMNESIEEYRDENIVITRPTTHEEMCKYGGGTKWCPAHKSGSRFFDSYKGSEGNFRIYVNRKTDERVAELIDSGKMYDQDDKQIYELPDWAKKQDGDFRIEIKPNSGPVKPDEPITLFPLVDGNVKEGLQEEMNRFKKLTSFNYKY
jgi:hypothetical protein